MALEQTLYSNPFQLTDIKNPDESFDPNENNVTEMFKKAENVVKPIETEKTDEHSVLKEFQGFQEFQGSQEFQESQEFQGFQGFQEVKENIDNADEFFEPECADENNVTETFVESENVDKPIETAKTDELIGFKIHKRIHSDEKLTPQSPKSPYMKAMEKYRDKLSDLISPITKNEIKKPEMQKENENIDKADESFESECDDKNDVTETFKDSENVITETFEDSENVYKPIESELKKSEVPESSNKKVRQKKKRDNSEFLSDTTSYTDVSTKKEKIVKTEESKRKCEVCKHIFYDVSSLNKHKRRKRCKQLISPMKKPKMQEENENFDKAYESFESESADENDVVGTFDQSEYEKRRVIY